MRQKACLLSSTTQCALALARWLPGSGLARNPILVWRWRSRSCRKRLQSSLQKATEDRMPRQAASAFFLRFFLSFVVSFVSRAFICHSCCHYYLQHSKAKQQSLCCLLAYLLLQYPSSFLLLLQTSSKEFIATSLLRVQFLFLPPPSFLSWLSELPRLL